MKIALVHDFLKEYGGAERVLEALHEIWPEAPIFTSFVDWKGLGPHAQRIKNWKIITQVGLGSWGFAKLHSPLRFLLPLVWESFDFSGFDVVISSSGWGICRGIVTRPETVHICYLHHPPRHLYGYQTALEWQKYLPVRIYGHMVNHWLRLYDYLAAQRVDYFIANSKETQRRIKKFYRRDSVVIYPPVKTQNSKLKVQNYNLKLKTEKTSYQLPATSYYLCVSRLAKAKHIDLAIEACQKLDEPLVVVGKGREEKKLKVKSQKSKVKFLGEVADSELAGIYQGAKALIFPAEDEEFGIVIVEAISFGVPVIVYKSGGVKETVIEGKTGLFFKELTVAALVEKIEEFNHKYYKNYNRYKKIKEDCQKQAEKFSQERFKKEILEFVEKVGF